MKDAELFDPAVRLPKDKQYVLAHLNIDNWRDSDCLNELYYWRVVKFERGLTVTERSALPDSDERKVMMKRGGEYGNNARGYSWDEFGPSHHFGQNVDMWCYLPHPPYRRK